MRSVCRQNIAPCQRSTVFKAINTSNNKIDRAPRAFAALIAAQVAGIAWLAILPFLVGAMVNRFALSPMAVGLVISTQLAGAAVASTLLSRIINEIPARKVVLAALALALVGNSLAGFSPNVEILVVSRLLAGLGEGCLLACCATAAALTRHTERTFAFYSIGISCFSVLALLSCPLLIDTFGLAGGYACVIIADMVAVVLVACGFPLRLHSNAYGDNKSKVSADLRKIGLLAVFFFSASNAGVQTFLERIGVEGLNVSNHALGPAMAIGAAAAVLSPFVIVFLAHKSGRLLAITISGLLLAGCMYAIAHTTIVSVYLCGAAALMPIAVFLQPYVVGVLATLDASGRLSAAATAVSSIGFAVAPTFAGMIAERWGLSSVGLFSSVAMVVCIVLLLKPAYAADRRSASV